MFSLHRFPYWLHAALTITAFALFQFAKAKLDQSYAASRHPVDYATGQLTFNAAKIEEFYVAMDRTKTLDVYWTTQITDFGFIASVALFGTFVGTLLMRGLSVGSWMRRLAMSVVAFALLGATLDILENLASFALLSFRAESPQWVAVLYSSFAAVKFVCITAAMLAAVISTTYLVARLVANFFNFSSSK